MAMNVRAAVLVSFGFIMSLCATVYYNRAPIIEGTALAGEAENLDHNPSTMPRRALPSVAAPQFRQSSPVESEIAANRSRPGLLTAVGNEIEPRKSNNDALPPLANSLVVHTPVQRTDEIVNAAEFVTKPTPIANAQDDQVLLPAHGRNAGAQQQPIATVVPVVAGGAETGRGQDQSKQSSDATGGSSYVVRSGDNLTKIAKRELKDSSPGAVAAILAANPELKGKPDKIIVGQRLNLPQLASPLTNDRPIVEANPQVDSKPALKGAAVERPSTPSKTKNAPADTKRIASAGDQDSKPSDVVKSTKSKSKTPSKKDRAVATKSDSRTSPSGPAKKTRVADASGTKAAENRSRQGVDADAAKTKANAMMKNDSGTTPGLKPITRASSTPDAVAANKTTKVGPDTMNSAGQPSRATAKRATDDQRKQAPPPQRSKKTDVAAAQTDSRDKSAGLKRLTAR